MKRNRPVIVIGQADGTFFIIHNDCGVRIELRDYDTEAEIEDVEVNPDRYGVDDDNDVYERAWLT